MADPIKVVGLLLDHPDAVLTARTPASIGTCSGQVVMKKIAAARDPAWRRFVWMPGDIAVTRPGREAADAGLADAPDAQTVRSSEPDELMDEIDRLIGGER